MPSLSCLKRPEAHDLAYVYTPPSGAGKDLPALVFLGGFKSDMEGTKAIFLEDFCKQQGQEFLRFDYRGHGQSDGKFEEGTIGLWAQDAKEIIENVIAPERQIILAGSSMGGWISMILLRDIPQRLAGFIGIAAAPDFTRKFYEAEFTAEQKAKLAEDGQVELPNDYSDEPYIITKALVDDGNDNCVMDGHYDLSVPVRLVQGMQDADVPWQTAEAIRSIMSGDVKVVLVEDGDHRLSRDQDLELIAAQVREICDVQQEDSA